MSRIDLIAKSLVEHGYDAYIAQTAVTLGYLAEFPEDGHERFLALVVRANGDSRLICPALSAEQATRVGVQNIRGWRDDEDPMVLFAELCEEWNLWAGVIVIDDQMPAKMVLDMQMVLTGALFKPGGPVLTSVMGVKEANELALMHAAGAVADEVFDAVIPKIAAGMSELQVEHMIRDEFKARGATPTFCIVGFGPGAAEPHHLNGGTKLERDTVVLLDFGCNLNGYNSDITRTFVFGTATSRHKLVYGVVAQAHEAARVAAAVGAIPCQIDAAARKVIVDAGFGEFFTHRTGHGIGRQVHEGPNISADNQTPLVAGNCFSIEPGIYLGGEFGIRLENIYTVSEAGAVSFNRPIMSTILELG